MAFALKGAGSATSAWSVASDQASLVVTTATTAGAANDLAVLLIAVDNLATADGDEAAVNSVTDSAGNFWQKAVEFTNGQGATQGGATCGIWYCNLQNPLAIGATVTIAFSSFTARDASAASLTYFTKAAGFKAAVEATPSTLANDAAAIGSLDCTTANIACLRIRAIATESSLATNLVKTAAFTAVLTQAVSVGGGAATNEAIRGEYLISTATGQASAPTGGAGSADHASVYVAFKEVAVDKGDPPHNSDSVGSQVAAIARKAVTATLIAASAGLFQTLYPVVQAAPAPAPNGWHAPLSPAPAVAQAQAGFSFVPFDTRQLSVNFTNFGWHGPTSTAPPVAQAQAGFSFVPFDTRQLSVNFTNYGWHAPLSPAPLVAKAQAGNSFVPLDTGQLSVNFTNFGWSAPLSVAPKVAQPQQGHASVPFNTVQTQYAANYTNLGWYAPLSPAPAVALARQGNSFVPFNTAQVAAAVAASGIPLDMGGASPRVRQVYYQSRFETPYVAPVVVAAYTNFWLQPLSIAASVARAVSDFGSVPLSTPAVVTVDKWQQPLSVAAPVAKARQGESYVPYNTAQLAVNYTNFGWYQALSGAPAVAKAQAGNSFVPYNTAQLVVSYFDFYLQPLSVAAPVAKAQVGFSYVPFNTAQLAVNYTDIDWYAPLSDAPAVATARLSDWSLPYTIVSPTGVAWQSPLAIAPPVAKAQQGFADVPLSPTRQVVVGWQQPLAIATVSTKAPPGFADVPLFYTASPVAGIAGIAWFAPLGTIPPRLLAAQQGNSFVPYNTAQTVVTATGRRKPLLFISNVGRLMN